MLTKIPFYLKAAQVLLALVAVFYILYVGQSIIVPLVFALLLAVLLNPFVNFLTRKKVNRVVAICLALLSLFIVVFGVFYFIGAQISTFSEALPELRIRAAALLDQGMAWFSDCFHVSQSQMDAWIDQKASEGLNEAGGRVGSTILSLSSLLVLVFLVPVYIFLFLYYKPLLLAFLGQVFHNHQAGTVTEVLASSKKMIQSYLMGLLIEMLIVAVLNSSALLIIGVDYAIVLGVIGAILNLIPYIGGVVAIALPVVMSLLSGTPSAALIVIGAYTLIQFIDNNFLVPMVVASKVKVNALVSIIVVLIGGAVWGVVGMFLAIPMTAILKVVFDKLPELNAFGLLIGDDLPPQSLLDSLKETVEESQVAAEEKAQPDK